MPAEKLVIRHEELHSDLRKKIGELKTARTIRLGMASGASYLALGQANRLVRQAMKKIEKSFKEGKVLGSGCSRAAGELAAKYPYAFVDRRGNVVLTSKPQGTKFLGLKVGRMRVPTR
ncbi:MAG: hypothetical protein NTY90_01875 [Candidatus Micrarchaeota archaeon]|nr:hypothetical protein [Candidatus Micrarchaeota archaeon]